MNLWASKISVVTKARWRQGKQLKRDSLLPVPHSSFHQRRGYSIMDRISRVACTSYEPRMHAFHRDPAYARCRVVSSSISTSSKIRWIRWKSDMSPPASMMVDEPTGSINRMLLKRASEPYKANHRKTQSAEALRRMKTVPRLSVATMIPSLYLNASTLVPLTIGSLGTETESALLCLTREYSLCMLDSSGCHSIRPPTVKS